MSKKTVMIVDDEQEIVDAVSFILESSERYQTISANDGEKGLEVFKKHNPDLVITDVHMGNANGLWLVKRIREIDDSKPIILMSSIVSQDTDDVSSKYQLFIQKPEDIKNILSVVDDFLDLEIL